VFAGKNGEAYLCTPRAARNMAFQGALETADQVHQLAELDGSALVGTKIKAPFGLIPEVYVLPMESVLATKVCVVPRRALRSLTPRRARAWSRPSRPTRQTTSRRSRT
jgi:hypothetical protein